MRAPFQGHKVHPGCDVGGATPYSLLRRVVHPAALALHLAAAVTLIALTVAVLADQDAQGQHAVCLATSSVSDSGFCSYLYLTAALPLAGFGVALLCCWPACPGTGSPLRMCRGLYGAVLAVWWAVAAVLLTSQLADGALPPPWEGWEASRVAAVAMIYVALACSVVQTVAGPGIWTGCCPDAAAAAAAEAAEMEGGAAAAPAARHPCLRVDNRTLAVVGVVGGAAS